MDGKEESQERIQSDDGGKDELPPVQHDNFQPKAAIVATKAGASASLMQKSVTEKNITNPISNPTSDQ